MSKQAVAACFKNRPRPYSIKKNWIQTTLILLSADSPAIHPDLPGLPWRVMFFVRWTLPSATPLRRFAKGPSGMAGGWRLQYLTLWI